MNKKETKKRIERYLRKKLIAKPQGNLFTRVLMRFYNFFYLRKEIRKFKKEYFKK